MQAFTLLALAGYAAAQAVTASIAPSTSAPGGCSANYAGAFEITTVQPAAKRDLAERQASSCGQTGILTIDLAGGILTDNLGRTGYIAGNNSQFQFDKPPQAGALYTAGFSVCSNGSLAIGDTTLFYSCQSGSFYNLYLENQGAQCQQVNIDAIPCSGSSVSAVASTASSTSSSSSSSSSTSSVAASTNSTSSTTTAAPLSVYTDGQPQATASATKAPISEFTDGQPQATANATKAATATILPAAGAAFTAPAALAIAGALAAVFL